MISLHHHLVFVHIPKCAGQSVEASIMQDIDLDYDRYKMLFLCFPAPKSWPGRLRRLAHLTALEYRDHYLPPQVFEQFYKFAVVRDPYAKAESHFHHGRFYRFMSFDRFILKDLPRRARSQGFFASQMSYLQDEQGGMLVDDIYRLENLEKDWPTIQKRAGIASPLISRNRSTVRLGLRWSGAMRRALEDLYAEDFERLGYARQEGEGPDALPPLNPSPPFLRAQAARWRRSLRTVMRS